MIDTERKEGAGGGPTISQKEKKIRIGRTEESLVRGKWRSKRRKRVFPTKQPKTSCQLRQPEEGRRTAMGPLGVGFLRSCRQLRFVVRKEDSPGKDPNNAPCVASDQCGTGPSGTSVPKFVAVNKLTERRQSAETKPILYTAKVKSQPAHTNNEDSGMTP